MPLNKQVFITRTISAVVFAIVMLVGLLWNHWSFLLLFAIIHFGCWFEYLRLTEQIHHYRFSSFEKLGMMLVGFSLVLSFCGEQYAIAGYGLRDNLLIPFGAAGFLLLAYGIISNPKPVHLKSFGAAAVGLLYISLSLGLMLLLRQQDSHTAMADNSRLFPILLIVSLWVNDTMAYIVGSMIGRTPFSKISPKKTWEGTIGGVLLAVVVVSFSAHYLVNTSLAMGIAVSLTAAVAGTAGDLVESWLKRRAGVKDSGTMMPGHGGFLDRFDSMLLATPFVWLVLLLMTQ